MKTNPSRDQLSKSMDRRIRRLMVNTLESFEDAFDDLDESRDAQIFKAHIKNSFNDVIRAQRDELRDYEVEYRPLRINEDNTLAITQTFMQTVQRVDMGVVNDLPWLKIYGSADKVKVLEAVRSEFGTGVIYEEEESVVLEIVGINSCVDSVLVIMDRYRLHADVRSKYRDWRGQVISLYRSKV
jgi:hypothetical protein